MTALISQYSPQDPTGLFVYLHKYTFIYVVHAFLSRSYQIFLHDPLERALPASGARGGFPSGRWVPRAAAQRLLGRLVLTNLEPSRFPHKHLSVDRLIRRCHNQTCPTQSLLEIRPRRCVELSMPRRRPNHSPAPAKATTMTRGQAISRPGRGSEFACLVWSADGGNCRVTEVIHVSDV